MKRYFFIFIIFFVIAESAVANYTTEDLYNDCLNAKMLKKENINNNTLNEEMMFNIIKCGFYIRGVADGVRLIDSKFESVGEKNLEISNFCVFQIIHYILMI
jgi:hypothetical protein